MRAPDFGFSVSQPVLFKSNSVDREALIFFYFKPLPLRDTLIILPSFNLNG